MADPVTPAPVAPTADPAPAAEPVVDPQLATPTPEPTADPTPAPAGSFNWLDSQPSELQGSDMLSRYKGENETEVLTAVAKSLIETKSLVGANTIKLPQRSDEPEKWTEFYTKAGRPAEASGYTLPTEGLPEGFKLTDEGLTQFKGLAHATGLNDHQAATLYRGYAEMVDSANKQATEVTQATQTENIAAIEKEYGSALPERVALSKRFIAHFDDKGEFATLLNETGLGNDPRMFRFIDKMAKQMKEDNILGEGSSAGIGNAPAEAQAKIGELQRDKEFMDQYYDKMHPGHQAAKDRMAKLNKEAFAVGS